MNAKTKNGNNPLDPLRAHVHAAITPTPTFKTRPTTRNSDGFHRGDGKPTEGPAQWGLYPGAKLPPRAFEPHEKERQRFYLLARSVSLSVDPSSEIQRIGGEIFDATYGAESVKFEREIEEGNLEFQRLNFEATRLEHEISEFDTALEDLPPTVEEQAEPCFPSLLSVKWFGFILSLALVFLSSGAAILQIANIYLPTMQSWLFACVAASPWVLAAVAGEIFLLLALKSDSQRVYKALQCAVGVLLAGMILWLSGLFLLAAPFNPVDITATGSLVPDRRWAVAGQLLCELAVSWLLLTGMLRLLACRRVTLPNENRRHITDHIAKLNQEWADLNKQLGSILKELANPEGNQREWNNSRAAFIEEGLVIVRLRMDDGALLAEIQQRRGENERLLGQFSA